MDCGALDAAKRLVLVTACRLDAATGLVKTVLARGRGMI